MTNARPLMVSELRTMREMAAKGATRPEVARAINRPLGTVWMWAHRYDLHFPLANSRPAWVSHFFCCHGHELKGDNLYVAPNGKRHCRTCERTWDKKRKRKRRGWLASRDCCLRCGAVFTRGRYDQSLYCSGCST